MIVRKVSIYIRWIFDSEKRWGQAKKELLALINDQIKDARERYVELMADPVFIESELQKGAEKAREQSAPMLKKVREAIGIVSIT